jgi:RNA polymerase sigma factor (sigma-70 family)
VIGWLCGVARRLGREALRQDAVTDGELLGAFVSSGDEAAFEELLRRHGPMVLGVCRRVLGDHDAEDAFQATFLVLARKAASLGRPQQVGNWLYGVAYRAALEGRAARRRWRELPLRAVPEPAAAEAAEDRGELRPLLDRELERLPRKFREAVVLCDIEGRTRREAASQLGIPEGTLSGRLTTARRRLARRLGRYGLPCSALAALTPEIAQAIVPESLFVSTIRAANQFAAGPAAAGAVLAPVAALAEGVIRAMFVSKLKAVGAALALLVLAGAAAAFGLGALPGKPQAAREGAPPPARADRKDDPTAPVTRPDQPRPVKVLVRPLKVRRNSLVPPEQEGSVIGKSLVKALHNKAELEKLVGKKAAVELAGQVDFAREDVVLVSWVGGPDTKLAYRLVGKKRARTVEFYLKEPPDDGRPKPLLATLHADFFAVPRGTPVQLHPRQGERTRDGKIPGVPPRAPKKDVSAPGEPKIAPPVRRD